MPRDEQGKNEISLGGIIHLIQKVIVGDTSKQV